MKKKYNINTVLIQFTLVIAILFTTSCNNSQKVEDTKEVAEDHNEAKFDKANEKDAQFLVNAAEINLTEIQLGQLAQQNSSNSSVKELGIMMEKAHSKALSDLTTLAGKKMVTIPTSLTNDGQDDYKKLSNKAGSEFAKEYCDKMVNGHKDAIAMFEKASTDCSDAEIREWASSMLPELRNHLDHSITCQKMCEK